LFTPILGQLICQRKFAQVPARLLNSLLKHLENFIKKILMALLSRMQGFAKSSSKCGAETESGFAWTTNIRVS